MEMIWEVVSKWNISFVAIGGGKCDPPAAHGILV